MLSITVLNVGHGDSIILKRQRMNQAYFGVIDSNRFPDKKKIPLLDELGRMQATELSFVALTHPHADHYSGLFDVLNTYKTNNLYTFPINAFVQGNKNHLQRLATIYMDLYDHTDDPEKKTTIAEFVQILLYGKEKIIEENWAEPAGPENRLYPDGFDDDEIRFLILLPPAKVKGAFFEALRTGKLNCVETPNVNSVSLAFLIEYKRIKVLLGGDGTLECWRDNRRSRKFQGLAASVAKLPHHGSRHDCSAEVIDYIFRDSGERFAIISANGRSHPASETLAALNQRKIQPYCTNLATECGSRVHDMGLSLKEFEPTLRRYIGTRTEPGKRGTQPCQGNVTITINDSGQVSVATQHNSFCPYRF